MDINSLKIVFWGSPEDAVPGLRTLSQNADVCCVYTKASEPRKSGSRPAPTAIKREADLLGIEVRTPSSLGDPATVEELKKCEADMFVIIAYGKFIPKDVLSIPRMGCVNVHPSLLPKYRGPSPVVAAILDGEEYTGASIILTDEELDAGPILRTSEPVRIDDKITAPELQAKLFSVGAEMLPALLQDMLRGAVTPRSQEHKLATQTKLVSKSDGEIDWRASAEEIARKIRAYANWPGTYTSWQTKTLKVIEATALNGVKIAHGKVVNMDGDVVVGCGEGGLRLDRVQLASKKDMRADVFIQGARGFVGSILPT